MKEKRPSFQYYPKDLLADANVATMTAEQFGAYWLLVSYCWIENGLRNDPDHLASLARISREKFDLFWPVIGASFRMSRRRVLVHKRLERERTKQSNFAKAKSESGKAGAAKRWNSVRNSYKQKTKIAEPLFANGKSMANDSSSSASPSPSAFAINSESVVSKTTSGVVHSLPPAEKRGRPPDEAYELWATAFERARKVGYGRTDNDFIKLTDLRKRLKIGTKETPNGWKHAIVNYLQSPSGKFTLADMCQRYDVFLNGKLNEYGKPDRGSGGGIHDKAKAVFQEALEKRNAKD